MTDRFYAHFDQSGRVDGLWDRLAYDGPEEGDPPIISAAITDGAVPIEESAYTQLLRFPDTVRLKGGQLVPFEPPIVLPVPSPISDRQFFQGLAKPPYQAISEAEAEDAVAIGKIPAPMVSALDQAEAMGLLPPGMTRFDVNITIKGATVYERSNPISEMVAAALGWTAEETDEFWRFCAAL